MDTGGRTGALINIIPTERTGENNIETLGDLTVHVDHMEVARIVRRNESIKEKNRRGIVMNTNKNKRTVEVVITVEVETDDTQFDKVFMENFSQYFYEFDSIEEHIEYIAQLQARELIDFDDFVEGYGRLKDMGISVKTISINTDIV